MKYSYQELNNAIIEINVNSNYLSMDNIIEIIEQDDIKNTALRISENIKYKRLIDKHNTLCDIGMTKIIKLINK